MLVKMLTPEPAKPNGHDRHPPEPAKPNGHDRHPPAPASGVSASPPRVMKTQFIANPAQVQAAEKRLLATLRANPGASIHALAKAAGANRSSTGERLRRLAAHGVCERRTRRANGK